MVKNLKGLAMEDIGVFYGHLVFIFLWPFGIFYGHLVCFPHFVPFCIWQPWSVTLGFSLKKHFQVFLENKLTLFKVLSAFRGLQKLVIASLSDQKCYQMP
jgi:hypothetical protein